MDHTVVSAIHVGYGNLGKYQPLVPVELEREAVWIVHPARKTPSAIR
jgi:hypothetical protein